MTRQDTHGKNVTSKGDSEAHNVVYQLCINKTGVWQGEETVSDIM